MSSIAQESEKRWDDWIHDVPDYLNHLRSIDLQLTYASRCCSWVGLTCQIDQIDDEFQGFVSSGTVLARLILIGLIGLISVTKRRLFTFKLRRLTTSILSTSSPLSFKLPAHRWYVLGFPCTLFWTVLLNSFWSSCNTLVQMICIGIPKYISIPLILSNRPNRSVHISFCFSFLEVKGKPLFRTRISAKRPIELL